MKLRSTTADGPVDIVIEKRPIASLTLDPENPRKHPKRQLKVLADAIKAHRVVNPILVDDDLKVISGHARIEACKRLRWADIPTVKISHLTPEQIRAFIIADNRIAELAEWDDRRLGLQLQALSALDLDFDIETTGFSLPEIDMLIEGLGEADATEEEAEIPPGPAACKPGMIFTVGRHRIVCASSLDPETYRRLLALERMAAVVSDAPYNVPIQGHVSGKGKRRHREFASAVGEMSDAEFTAFLAQAMRLAAEHSEDGSVHFWFMDWRHIEHLIAASRSSYDAMINLCVWAKNNGSMGSLYRSAHELVAVFKRGTKPHRNNVQLGRFGRNRTNIWTYAGANSFLRSSEEADLLAQHPTPKPVAMIADALLDVTARGDLVLDPFLGSGSTLMACERVGRVCRGIELDPLYVDLAIRRWQRLTGGSALLEETGQTFDQLAALTLEPAE